MARPRKPAKIPPRKVSRRFKPITCWVEVDAAGEFTCYDLAPTRFGIEGYMPEGHRAVKVRIVKAGP